MVENLDYIPFSPAARGTFRGLPPTVGTGATAQ